MQRFSLSAVRIRGDIPAPLGFAIGMIVGAGLYVSLPFEPALGAILCCFGVAVMGLILAIRLPLPAALLNGLIVICGIGGGAVAGSLAVQRSHHQVIVAPTGPVLLEGWVRAVESGRRGVRLVIDVHAIDGMDARQTPGRVRLTHTLSLNTEPGRFVRCWAVLRPPPQPVSPGDYDFARQAWFSGLGAVGYVQGRCRGGALGRPARAIDHVSLTIGAWRRRLAQHVNSAAGDRAGGFAAALASGDRSFMRPDDQEALRNSGLAHLLAISGLHMGIVGGLVFLFLWRIFALIEPIALRWSVKKPAAAGALLTCAAYLLISGASVSTQRAFIMSAVAFTAILFDRAAVSLRSLSIAMIIIIAIAPWSVLSPGFQMSFAATGALVATYEAWRRHRRQSPDISTNGVLFWGQSLMVTSTVSGLATAPFAMFHFERVAGLGLLANFAAMPIISLISAPLAGAALLLAPFGGDEVALRLFGASLQLVLWIAHTFADWGQAQSMALPKMPATSLGLFALAILAYATLTQPVQKIVGVISLVGLSVSVWSITATDRLHWAPSGEVFLEHKNGQVERLRFAEGDGLAPLRFADTPVTATCAVGDTCVYPFAGDLIRLSSQTATGSSQRRLTIMPAHRPEPILSTEWQDVVRENGVTLEHRRGQFIKRAKPICGRRPWRPCPSD